MGPQRSITDYRTAGYGVLQKSSPVEFIKAKKSVAGYI